VLTYATVKSYFLENISSAEAATIELRRLLPGQENPWLLTTADGDAIAYFNVEPDLSCVTADISGRHYNEDAAVVCVLRQLQSIVGGIVVDVVPSRDNRAKARASHDEARCGCSAYRRR